MACYPGCHIRIVVDMASDHDGSVADLKPAGIVKALDYDEEDGREPETEATEEVRLLATADPERLRRSLHKATGKKEVDLVLIPPNKPIKKSSDGGSRHKEGPRLVDAAAVEPPLADPQLEALLAHLQRQAPLRGHRDQYVDHGAAAALPGNYHHHQQQQPNLDWDSYGEASYPWVPLHWLAPPAVDWGANYGPALAPPATATPAHRRGTAA
ncbi:uncharacterized protein LOC125517044 [Triticum urartu]|uniref:uncharacterized protein LOC125517044 n=1 Tax=Triticum urartu TaxID=4572 RepID=UPI002043D0B7|nr:uncharacterized protein LOC125517044 [Triticum urartu]